MIKSSKILLLGLTLSVTLCVFEVAACMCSTSSSFSEESIKKASESAKVIFIGKSLGEKKFKVYKNFKGAEQDIIDLESFRKGPKEKQYESTCQVWAFHPGRIYFVYAIELSYEDATVLEAQQCDTFEIELGDPESLSEISDYDSLKKVLENDKTILKSWDDDSKRYITMFNLYEQFSQKKVAATYKWLSPSFCLS